MWPLLFVVAIAPDDAIPNRLKTFAPVTSRAVEPPLPFGRLVSRPTLHVGVRPHFYATAGDEPELAVAVTLQISL